MNVFYFSFCVANECSNGHYHNYIFIMSLFCNAHTTSNNAKQAYNNEKQETIERNEETFIWDPLWYNIYY